MKMQNHVRSLAANHAKVVRYAERISRRDVGLMSYYKALDLYLRALNRYLLLLDIVEGEKPSAAKPYLKFPVPAYSDEMVKAYAKLHPRLSDWYESITDEDEVDI